MKQQMKNLAAATTLAVGLSATANAAQVEQIAPTVPQEDIYDPSVSIPFNISACTTDSYTVPALTIIQPSITDLREKILSGEISSEEQLKDTLTGLGKYAQESWKNTVKGFSSAHFQEDSTAAQKQEVMERYIENMQSMARKIEEDTGISVIGQTGMSKPVKGCAP